MDVSQSTYGHPTTSKNGRCIRRLFGESLPLLIAPAAFSASHLSLDRPREHDKVHATTVTSPHAQLQMLLRARAVAASSRLARPAWRASSRMSSTSTSSAAIAQPTTQQLRRHALNMAVPMVGFGCMRNLVMIQAGDLIDNSIGVAFGLATLTSAAYGQIVSDVCGTVSSGFVEALAAKLGLPRAGLTMEQLSLRRVQVAGTTGAVIGVAIGCLLGMSCLFVMDLEKSERLKKQRELRTLYSVLMEEGHNLIGAQHCALFLVDKTPSADGHTYLTSMGWKGVEPTNDELQRTFNRYDKDGSGFVTVDELYGALRGMGWTAELQEVEAMVATVHKDGPASAKLNLSEFSQLMKSAVLQDEVRLKMRSGGTREVVLSTGKILNVRNVESDPRIGDESRRRYQLRGYDVKSILIAPVFDDAGGVVGLIELVNKECDAPGDRGKLVRRNSEYGFSTDDEKLLNMLCAHCSIFLRHMDTSQ